MVSITNQQLYDLHASYQAFIGAENRERGYDARYTAGLYAEYVKVCDGIGIDPVSIGQKLWWYAQIHWNQLYQAIQDGRGEGLNI